MRRVLFSLAVLALAGCAYTPDSRLPEVEMPATLATTGGPGDWPDTGWWRAFGSPALDMLIAAARTRNPDLAIALARVDRAAAAARIAGARLLPAVVGSGSANRQGQRTGGESTHSTSFGAALAASYEVDLWGLNSASAAAARARLAASRYDRQIVALALTADVAGFYFEVLSVRDRLRLAQDSLVNARAVLRLVEARERAGTALGGEVAQQRALVASQESVIPALEQQETVAMAALAVLLDRPAQTLAVPGDSLDALRMPAVAPGQPSTLLVRRPDIASAEAALAAADADVAAARAAMLPRIDLTTAGSVDHVVIGGATGGVSTLAYSLAAGIAQTIFDGGALAGRRELTEAQRRALIAAYRSAVANAFADVETALKAIERLDRQATSQQTVLAESRRAFTLAEAQYRAGAADLLTVLDTQRSLYSAQDTLARLRFARLQARVDLFTALGGGWQRSGHE